MNSQRLPALDGRAVVKALERAGFTIARTSGSHVRLIHADDPSRHTTAPVHKGRDLPRGTLRDIIDQAGLTVGEFIDLL